MKRILFIGILIFSFGANIQAQTLEDADLLFSKKKYLEAAEIYYQQYQFSKAAQAYRMQTDVLMKAKKPQTQTIDSIKPLLKRVENLARMVSRCEDIQIIDSVITDKNNFLKAYLVSSETGTFEQANASVVYENQLKDRRYFGKKDKSGFFRLYSQQKIQDNWSDEKPLNIPSDNTGNDNFPFVMPDGVTIYYASTGNGSIGGYDLFVSRYNSDNDTYLAPSQMGMPFNSLYNDYMLVIDELNNIGYFATDRFQPEDKVVIYTFIPNSEVKPIESADEQLLISRAKITAIRDSWRPNVNYRNILAKLKADIASEKAQSNVKKDFTFVVNDSIVYHTLADFESNTAKNSYLQSKEMGDKIRTMENQLDAQRKTFAEGNQAKKQSLRSSILANERQLETMIQSYNKFLVDSRNAEIKYLRTKK